MRKLIAPLVAGLTMLGLPLMPSASALEHAPFDCGFDTIAQETATGGQDTFTGAAFGYIVSPTPGESVSIQCWVRVDGDRVDETPTGTGTQGATTQGQVTYTASDTQDVDLCADWSAGAESGSVCFETTTTTIPPQEVIDAINSVFDLFAELTGPTDPIICGALQTAGVPGLVNSVTSITGIWVDPDDCDIWLVRNNPLFDCPTRLIDFIVPYGDAPRSDMPACF